MINLRNIFILMMFVCFCAGKLSARSYFLPDYQGKTYKDRINAGLDKDKVEAKCSTYNAFETKQSDMNCYEFHPLPGLTCYKCSCDGYDVETCTDGKMIPDPNDKCGGKSKSCVCDPDLYKKEGTCDTGYKSDKSDSCTDSNGIKYKCIEDPCAGLTSKSICNNTVSGGYCVQPTVVGCEDYCSDCVDYCQGMGQYEGAVSCAYGCLPGYEIDGCDNQCKGGIENCALPTITCSDDNNGNHVDASALIDDPNTPYDNRCEELGYTPQSCGAGYNQVGCPFNTTTDRYYHCVKVESYQEGGDIVLEVCPTPFTTEASCYNDDNSNFCSTTSDSFCWRELTFSGSANGKSCKKCSCMFMTYSACSNYGRNECVEDGTMLGSTCYKPICEEGWKALIPEGDNEYYACEEAQGGTWMQWDGSDYCYRCDVEAQFCEVDYYSIYDQRVYELKRNGEDNYLCKPQIGENAYDYCVQCEECDDSNQDDEGINKKYTDSDVWHDAAQNCTETGGAFEGAGCYYKCVYADDDSGGDDVDPCQENGLYNETNAQIECKSYGAMMRAGSARGTQCYECISVSDDISMTMYDQVEFIPSDNCEKGTHIYDWDYACEVGPLNGTIACIGADGKKRMCCTAHTAAILCDQ